MKAKKMTQKLTLLTFTALFIAFMFNACSDVAGPNENLNNEYSQLNSSDTEMQDIRSRRLRTTSGGQSVSPPSCSIGDQIITAGGAGQNVDERTEVGTISVTYDNGDLVLTIKPKEGWEFSESRVHISTDGPDYTFPNAFGQYNQGTVDYDPRVVYPNTVYRTVTQNQLSSLGISDGNPFAVAVKVQAHEEGSNGNGGETATTGDEDQGIANRKYFEITYSCPASGAFNGAG